MNATLTAEGLARTDGRQVAWSDLYHVEWTATGGLVATADGVLTVDRPTAAALEQRLTPWEAERDAWVDGLDDAERAAWVGLGPDEQLVARQKPGMAWLAGIMWLFAALFVPFLFLGEAFGVVMFLLCGSLFGALGWLVWRQHVGADLTLSAQGLTLGRMRPRRLRWSALRAAAEQRVAVQGRATNSHLVLFTRGGRETVKDQYRDGERLRAGLRQALVARVEAVPRATEAGRFAPSFRYPGQGLWLDDDGLVVVEHETSRRIAWSAMRPLQWLASGPELSWGQRPLKLREYASGEDLAHLIDARLGGDAPLVDAAGDLRDEAIERWLGVAPGGALRCGLQPWKLWGCGLGLCGALALVVLLTIAGGHGSGGSIQGLVYAALAFGAMVRSARSVDADARGLSVRRRGRREYYAWSEIESVTEDQYEWRIVTGRGTVRLARAATGANQVIGIVRRLLAMRETGAQLPSDLPTPENAISRMGAPVAEGVERGLSVSRDE